MLVWSSLLLCVRSVVSSLLPREPSKQAHAAPRLRNDRRGLQGFEHVRFVLVAFEIERDNTVRAPAVLANARVEPLEEFAAPRRTREVTRRRLPQLAQKARSKPRSVPKVAHHCALDQKQIQASVGHRVLRGAPADVPRISLDVAAELQMEHQPHVASPGFRPLVGQDMDGVVVQSAITNAARCLVISFAVSVLDTRSARLALCTRVVDVDTRGEVTTFTHQQRAQRSRRNRVHQRNTRDRP